jgi:hypothetical protein
VRQRLLTALNTARVWVNRLVWARRSMRAYGQAPEPGSVVTRFRDNEEIPLRGQVWRVAKRVGGPDPAILLQPVGPTNAVVKRAEKFGRRQRQSLEQQRSKMRARVKDHQLVDRLGGSKTS